MLVADLPGVYVAQLIVSDGRLDSSIFDECHGGAVGIFNYLTVWPTGIAQPLVSTLNVGDGQVTANALIVPAGTGGAVSAFATETTHLILDISAYFAP